MATAPATVAVCDRGDCPAPAQRTLVLHDQDFHFCGHHAVELMDAIGAQDAAGTAGAITDASDMAPAARPVRDRPLTAGRST